MNVLQYLWGRSECEKRSPGSYHPIERSNGMVQRSLLNLSVQVVQVIQAIMRCKIFYHQKDNHNAIYLYVFLTKEGLVFFGHSGWISPSIHNKSRRVRLNNNDVEHLLFLVSVNFKHHSVVISLRRNTQWVKKNSQYTVRRGKYKKNSIMRALTRIRLFILLDYIATWWVKFIIFTPLAI